MTETTPEECEANYLSGIEVEADFFIYYFEIEYPSDEFRNEVIEFYKEIYSHSNYTVGSASKLDDNTYAVKLNVQPIDIIDQVMTDWDAGMAPFWDKYADADVSAMSEEEYKQFDADWGRAILDLAKSKMSSIGYMEEQSLAVQVIRDEDGIWQIADNDFSTIDNAIIYYP